MICRCVVRFLLTSFHITDRYHVLPDWSNKSRVLPLILDSENGTLHLNRDETTCIVRMDKVEICVSLAIDVRDRILFVIVPSEIRRYSREITDLSKTLLVGCSFAKE